MTATEFYTLLTGKSLTEAQLAPMLVSALKQSGCKIAAAESCTGGLICEKITSVPGASSVFDCGICAYANHIKEQLLQVNAKTLLQYGAVSMQTAAQMAQGVRRLAGADIGISTTGIAGPSGGTGEKPVGLVFIGCSTTDHTTVIKALLADAGDGSRQRIRHTAACVALYSALQALGR